MNTLKWVILGTIAMALCCPGVAMAETPPGCTGTGLDETLLPSGQYVHVGETLCYEIWLAVNAPKCDMEDVEVLFWRPDDVPPDPLNICGSPGGTVIASGLYLAQGAPPIILDCGTYSILEYTVQEADIVIVDGVPAVLAYVCIRGTQLVGPPSTPGQDAKAIPNFVLQADVGITKEVDCDISKQGDEVIYTICIENIGTAPLFNVVVDDPHLGGVLPGFPSELTPGQSVCLDFPYTMQPGDEPGPVENTVTLTAEDATGFAVSVFATETVTLVHPDFELTKICLTDPVPPGADAEFEITVTNIGDVELDFTTNHAGVGPFSLAPGGVFQVVVSVPVPPGAAEVCNEITVTATIPPQYCNLPNELVRTAGDCCPVPPSGEDGCTPGYWKNHPDCWCDRFDPDDLLGDVFAIPSELDYHSGNSLMDALNYSGGRLKGSGGSDATELERAAGRLLFHAVAALLNGCHNDVAFPMTADGVIDAVNAALATLDMGEFGILHDTLEEYNELGCPIDAHCRPHPDED